MASCCSSSTNADTSTNDTNGTSQGPKRHVCPANGKEYLQVPLSTILQHIKKPWQAAHSNLIEQGYYYCEDPDCDVVYFGENNLSIKKTALRTSVGIKEPNNQDALSCYCFDISHGEAKNNPQLKQYVIEKTKNKTCACEIRNPSGRCCFKGFSLG